MKTEQDDIPFRKFGTVVFRQTDTILAVAHERIHTVPLDGQRNIGSGSKAVGYLSEKDIVRNQDCIAGII